MIQILNNENIEIKKYPYIGKSKLDQIVIFIKSGCGIQIYKGFSKCEMNEYSDCWNESLFEKYMEPITICNYKEVIK
jgi:hypothetical protein